MKAHAKVRETLRALWENCSVFQLRAEQFGAVTKQLTLEPLAAL
jgi:hypothetical protein